MTVLSENAAEVLSVITAEGITFRELRERFATSGEDTWAVMKAVRELRSHGLAEMNPCLFVDTAVITRTVRYVAGNSITESLLITIPHHGIHYGELMKKLSTVHEGELVSTISELVALGSLKTTPQGILNMHTIIEVIQEEDKVPRFISRR